MKIVIDLGGTKIFGGLFDLENKLIFSKKIEIGEYDFKKVLEKINNLIQELKNDNEINYIGISLNGQVNNNFVYFSRVLGGEINKNLELFIKKDENCTIKIENDVNSMCLGYNFLEKPKDRYLVLLNIGTGVRSSYLYNSSLLKGKNGFFGEIRDEIFVEELGQNININDLVCGRGITNIYKILTGKEKTSQEIYTNIKKDEISFKTINIFKKYFINLILRISYTFNPDTIVIDGSLKEIINDDFENILKNYKSLCQSHFIANIKISTHENTAIYGALFIN